MESIIREKIELVNIYYDDKEIPYIFGASCIEESMAYLIESEKFLGLCRVNELPYNSCEIVCQNLCPKLVERKDIIVALAEISLMHFNSGVMFVKLVEMISEKDIYFKNSYEVAAYFKNYISHLFKIMNKLLLKQQKLLIFFILKTLPLRILMFG